MQNRKNESQKIWFRSERVSRIDGRWYFHTREGLDVGPYESRFEAEIDATLLMASLKAADPERAKTVIREFMLFSDSEDADFTDMPDSAYTDYVIEDVHEVLRSIRA
jgi:hypothetical protein